MYRTASGFDPFSVLKQEMDRLFDDFVPASQGFSQTGGVNSPAVNVWEDQESIFVETELPGISMEELDLTVQGNQLLIRGERKDGGDKAVYHRRERARGKFSRALYLPYEVDFEHIEARLSDGVLTIRLPKAESAKPRKISVVH